MPKFQNNFTKYVYNEEPANPPLPLTHITDGLGFRTILESNALKPKHCSIFDEKILYFFYGRAAYRVNPNISNSKLGALHPVCIILRPDAIKVAKRVYPFDSGAYMSGLFSKSMHHKFDKDSFLVNPNPNSPNQIPIPEAPSKIVSTFFKNNFSYHYNNNPKKGYELQEFGMNFEAECYHELITTKSEKPYDDRSSTIEIQTNETVVLSSKTVCGVICPITFFEDVCMIETVLEKWRAEVLTYETYRSEPAAFIGLIMDRLGQFLNKNKLIERP